MRHAHFQRVPEEERRLPHIESLAWLIQPGIDDDCTFEDGREAILTILGAKEDEDLRVGGRFGAALLVRVVRTLLAKEELSADGRLSEAIAWVSSVQRRVNDLWVLSLVSDEAEAC